MALRTALRSSLWSRRAWLTQHARHAAVLALAPRPRRVRWEIPHSARRTLGAPNAPPRVQALLDPAPLQRLAQQGVDAARAAGARYADVRLTRTVAQQFSTNGSGDLMQGEVEEIGAGVRALVDGYWGFAAYPLWLTATDGTDVMVSLARNAVAQAKVNAQGPPRTVELGTYPIASGSWTTPIDIDPFRVSVEEKIDWMRYIDSYANVRANASFYPVLGHLRLVFLRQERVVATSDGAVFTQTCYATGGDNLLGWGDNNGQTGRRLTGLDLEASGWEKILHRAQFEAQIDQVRTTVATEEAIGSKPFVVGRYTLVCDGATMAALLGATLGVATQLDRCLGYEANASGTSFLDDPLHMVGEFSLAGPRVTVTANRSAPGQLATVKWDDEGVTPEPFPLIKDGVLVDFQTTRESAAWLAPYYAKTGRPVRSHGCAASEDALVPPLQMMPNLALEPSTAAIRLTDLIADVKDGLLLTEGEVSQVDFQARSGLLRGRLREIKNGRVGHFVGGGAVIFTTQDLWKKVVALGGPTTVNPRPVPIPQQLGITLPVLSGGHGSDKGAPSQTTLCSAQAAAATILSQPLIDPTRKA